MGLPFLCDVLKYPLANLELNYRVVFNLSYNTLRNITMIQNNENDVESDVVGKDK
jgi:uncharacterized membrane protein